MTSDSSRLSMIYIWVLCFSIWLNKLPRTFKLPLIIFWENIIMKPPIIGILKYMSTVISSSFPVMTARYILSKPVGNIVYRHTLLKFDILKWYIIISQVHAEVRLLKITRSCHLSYSIKSLECSKSMVLTANLRYIMQLQTNIQVMFSVFLPIMIRNVCTIVETM